MKQHLLKTIIALFSLFFMYAEGHAGSLSGLASYYREGHRTASGERFDPQALTAAHPSLPFGTKVRVTHLASQRSVIVKINDRGPFIRGRIIDLSYGAAKQLGLNTLGVGKVALQILPPTPAPQSVVMAR